MNSWLVTGDTSTYSYLSSRLPRDASTTVFEKERRISGVVENRLSEHSKLGLERLYSRGIERRQALLLFKGYRRSAKEVRRRDCP
jgi:hypothetical protein